MINYEKWFNSSIDFLEQEKNYQAIRNFNGGIFRLLTSEKIQQKKEITSKTMILFLEKLSKKDLNHEIFQVMSSYFSVVKKNSLSDDYIFLIFNIPEKSNILPLGIEILSNCVLLLSQIGSEEIKTKYFFSLEEATLNWIQKIETVDKNDKTSLNVNLILLRIYILNSKLFDAYKLLENIFLDNQVNLDSLIEVDDFINISLLRAYLLTLNGNLDKGIGFLKNIKSTIKSITDNELFKIGLDILPSIRSTDSDWFLENKEFIIIKFRTNQKYSKLLNLIIIELQRKFFPDTINSKQLLDFL